MCIKCSNGGLARCYEKNHREDKGIKLAKKVEESRFSRTGYTSISQELFSYNCFCPEANKYTRRQGKDLFSRILGFTVFLKIFLFEHL